MKKILGLSLLAINALSSSAFAVEVCTISVIDKYTSEISCTVRAKKVCSRIERESDDDITRARYDEHNVLLPNTRYFFNDRRAEVIKELLKNGYHVKTDAIFVKR